MISCLLRLTETNRIVVMQSKNGGLKEYLSPINLKNPMGAKLKIKCVVHVIFWWVALANIKGPGGVLFPHRFKKKISSHLRLTETNRIFVMQSKKWEPKRIPFTHRFKR